MAISKETLLGSLCNFKKYQDSSNSKRFVSQEDGKGLSTNDFTDAYREKLDSLENYELPTASETEKGGIMIGTGLEMDGDVLNVTVTGGGDYDDFIGATSLKAEANGLVPAPKIGEQTRFLRGDGTWSDDIMDYSQESGQTIREKKNI